MHSCAYWKCLKCLKYPKYLKCLNCLKFSKWLYVRIYSFAKKCSICKLSCQMTWKRGPPRHEQKLSTYFTHCSQLKILESWYSWYTSYFSLAPPFILNELSLSVFKSLSYLPILKILRSSLIFEEVEVFCFFKLMSSIWQNLRLSFSYSRCHLPSYET